MNFISFFTQETKQIGTTPLLNNDVLQSDGHAFWKALLAEAQSALESISKENEIKTNISRDTLNQNIKEELQQTFHADETNGEIQNILQTLFLGPQSTLTETLALNQQAFDNTLKPLTNGIITSAEIANGSPRILSALVIEPDNKKDIFLFKQNGLKENIQKLLQEKNTAQLLANLTPEQITALQKTLAQNTDLNGLENSEGPALAETLSALGITVVALIPPQRNTSTLEKTAHSTEDFLQNGTLPKKQRPAGDDLEGLENVLVLLAPPPLLQNARPLPTDLALQTAPQGTSQTPAQPPALDPATPQMVPSAPTPAETGGTYGTEDFDTTLQNFGLKRNATGNTGHIGENSGSKENADLLLSSAGQALQTAPLSPHAPLQDLFFDVSGTLLVDPAGDHNSALATTNAYPMATLTSLVTQSAGVVHAHPATQFLAMTLQKAAGQGDNRTFIMDMDPPELGRIEVQMSFTKDKSLKTHIIAEKPETYLMLQRDSGTLERLLEQAGVDTNGGMSFSLADQGEHTFTNDQRNAPSGGPAQGSDPENTDPNTIQSTMTWHVDPHSGYTRYDILA